MDRSRSPAKQTKPGRAEAAAAQRPWFGAVPWKKVAIASLSVCAVGAAAELLRPLVSRAWTARRFAQAQQMLAAGQEDAGTAALRGVLERDAGHAPARLALARLELKRGRLEQAFFQFESYTELAPLDPEGWLGLTEVRQRAGQPEEAEAALGRAIEL